MKMTDAEKTAAIMELLKSRARGLIWAEELAIASGARRCDFWTLHPHRGKGYYATAHEVKVSRSDYRRDTYEKQREARLFSDAFYYVTPTGLLKEGELPDWAGLMEWDGERLKVSREAPHRDKDAPTWELVVSIMRNSGDIRRDTDLLRAQLKEAQGYASRAEKRERETMDRLWAAEAKVRELTKSKAA